MEDRINYLVIEGVASNKDRVTGNSGRIRIALSGLSEHSYSVKKELCV